MSGKSPLGSWDQQSYCPKAFMLGVKFMGGKLLHYNATINGSTVSARKVQSPAIFKAPDNARCA